MFKLFRHILGLGRTGNRSCVKFAFACWAIKLPKIILTWLEDRLSPILVAICAYIMRWFRIAHRFSQRIEDSTLPCGCKLVALFLSFPCFYAHNFLFKIAYLLNCRRMVRLSLKCAAMVSLWDTPIRKA